MVVALFFFVIHAKTVYKTVYEDEYQKYERLRRHGIATLKTELCTDRLVHHETGRFGAETCSEARKYATLDVDEKANEKAMSAVSERVYDSLDLLFSSTILSWIWSGRAQTMQSTLSFFAVFTSSIMGSFVGNIFGMIGFTMVLLFLGYYCIYRPGRKASDTFRIECKDNVCRLIPHPSNKSTDHQIVIDDTKRQQQKILHPAGKQL